MQTIVTWNGHSNFMLQGAGCTVLVDPFFDDNPAAPYTWTDLPKPDLVLVTHDHADHRGQAVEICCETGAMLGCIVGTGDVLAEAGVPRNQIINGIGFNIGGTAEVAGIKVTMTEAFHSSDSGFPAGYIITMPGGFTVYHAGDTSIFANMSTWGEVYKIDLALVPIGGMFTMDGRQAALACKLLKAGTVIPMHYGTFPVLEQTVDEFALELLKTAPDCELVHIAPGGHIAF